MEPATATLIAAAVQAAGSIGGGILANKGAGKETKMQKTRRKLVDQLINGMQSGEGPYANLFANDEAAFQKSFVEPAQSMFKNKIAPTIQGSYSAAGQVGGSGLDDQLLRAGVDLDQLLNKEYMNFQEKGKDRMSNLINSIIHGETGAPAGLTTGEATAQSAAGYLSSEAYGNSVKDIFKTPATPAPPTGKSPQGYAPSRKTFEPNWRDVQFAQR